MPHITIKHFPPALPDDSKQPLADALTKLIVEHFGTNEDAVSISVQTVDPGAWQQDVFDPEITGRAGTLIKTPNYRPAGESA